MSKQKLGIMTISLCALVGFGYLLYLFAYPYVWNWVGYPTHHQVAGFYDFAEEIGYVPENKIAFNRRDCSGRPWSHICVSKLIFKIEQPISDIITNNPSLVQLNLIERYSSGSNLAGVFRDAGVELKINGRGYAEVPSPPSYPVQSIDLLHTETRQEWTVSAYQTRSISHVVEIDGILERKDFVIITLIVKDTRIDYDDLD